MKDFVDFSKESDYWLRSIIHNKELSTTNDKQQKNL